MTAERDGKGRGAGRPNLLASLPAEDPPASPPAPGIDPAEIEELLTGMRDLREQMAGLREAVSAERSAAEPAAVPESLTLETLNAWGDSLVTRVAEAARTAAKPSATPKDDAAATHIERMEDAAAKAAAAAERIDQGMETTSDRVGAEIGEAVTRIETGLAKTRDHVAQVSRLAHGALHDIETRVSGRFSKWTIVAGVIVFVLGMLLESYGLVFYRWLRAD